MAPDVIIIGGGAAGLAAAQVLSDSGCRLVILEARARLGGRILTRHDPATGVPMELGAEFIHGRPQVTWDLVRQAHLVAVDLPSDHQQRRRGRPVSRPTADAGFHKLMQGLARLGPRDRSLAEYLRTPDARARSVESRRLARSFVEGFDAADPERISVQALAEEYQGIGNVEQEMQFRLLQGYGSLIDYLRRCLHPTRVKIRLSAPVSEIHWRRSRVEVRITAGRGAALVHAPRAIITLPLGILQLPGQAGGAVRFIPDMAGKRAAAARLAPGAVTKVLLRFREAFWEDPAFVRSDASWRDAFFLHSPGAPFPTWWTMRPLHVPLLVAWAAGPKATALAGLSQRQLLQTALESLVRMLPARHRRLDALVQQGYAYDWAADPLARGAYSYVTVGGMAAHAALARPIERTLFFAGEATDTSGQASTVAGALASGQRAARQVLATF